MKNRPISKLLVTGFIAVGVIFSAQAQLDQLGKILSYQVDNAEILLEEYIGPFTNAIGTDLSNGWYNTAKPHETLGFDITFTLNTTFVPEVDQTFNPEDIGLQGGITSNQSSSPTFMGENKNAATLVYEDDFGGTLGAPIEVARFDLPKGSGLSFTPAPMLQVGVGIIKETELIGRFTPKLQLGNQAEIGLWGVGVKHSVKQWIPAINKIPVLQLSIMGGYTHLNSNTSLDFSPSAYIDAGLVSTANVWDYGTHYDNQEVDLQISSFTTNLLVGADLPVVCFYAGVGLNSVKTTVDLNGNYPLMGINSGTLQPEITEATSVTDPISLEIESDNGIQPRFNIGTRFKFAVITLHFDYTFADYSVATVGLGISFR